MRAAASRTQPAASPPDPVTGPSLADEQLEAVADTFKDRAPLLANMVEGGATPITGADDLESLGFSIVIFPGGIVRALAKTAQDYYGSLAKHGSNRPFAERMFDFENSIKLFYYRSFIFGNITSVQGPFFVFFTDIYCIAFRFFIACW